MRCKNIAKRNSSGLDLIQIGTDLRRELLGGAQCGSVWDIARHQHLDKENQKEEENNFEGGAQIGSETFMYA